MSDTADDAPQSHAIFDALAKRDVSRIRLIVGDDAQALDATIGSGATPLHVAVHERQYDIVELLLALGASPHAETDWGGTPLSSALLWGDRRLVDLLVEVGGVVPRDLPTASGVGDWSMVQSFFHADGSLAPDAGAPVSCETREGRWVQSPSPDDDVAILSQGLHLAARNGQVDMVAFLVERGADINAPGFFGALPQHWAAACNQGEMVDWLVSHGADPAARDPKFDATVIGWAREFGHDDLAAALEAKYEA